MKIQTIKSQSRRDFRAIYECDHCGHTQEGDGYDDAYFHCNVIIVDYNYNGDAILAYEERRAAPQPDKGAQAAVTDDLSAFLKDIHWRIEDTREQLLTKRMNDESLYGIDEWSSPAINLQKVLDKLEAFVRGRS